MKYLPLNTAIDTGSRDESIIFVIGHVTEKAILIEKSSSRHGADGEVWIPKSSLIAATRAGLVFDPGTIADDRLGYAAQSFGYRYDFATDAREVRKWAAQRTIETGAPVSQGDLDAQFGAKKPATCHDIMTRAWVIAREAAARFGGSSRAYFAESLRLAWAEAR
jgi:hypothetical protein